MTNRSKSHPEIDATLDTPSTQPLLEKLDDFQNELQKFREQTTQFVRANPLVSVAASLALGYWLAKILRPERVIYVEKEHK